MGHGGASIMNEIGLKVSFNVAKLSSRASSSASGTKVSVQRRRLFKFWRRHDAPGQHPNPHAMLPRLPPRLLRVLPRRTPLHQQARSLSATGAPPFQPPEIVSALNEMGLPSHDAHDFPVSDKRFEDGAHYRIEIPSTEGIAAMKAVVEEAKRWDVRVHRVSQGSGE